MDMAQQIALEVKTVTTRNRMSNERYPNHLIAARLMRMGACYDSIKWVLSQPAMTEQQLWDGCQDIDWMFWYIYASDPNLGKSSSDPQATNIERLYFDIARTVNKHTSPTVSHLVNTVLDTLSVMFRERDSIPSRIRVSLMDGLLVGVMQSSAVAYTTMYSVNDLRCPDVQASKDYAVLNLVQGMCMPYHDNLSGSVMGLVKWFSWEPGRMTDIIRSWFPLVPSDVKAQEYQDSRGRSEVSQILDQHHFASECFDQHDQDSDGYTSEDEEQATNAQG